MIEISLPHFIKFTQLDPPPDMDDFLQVIDPNYDISYIVKADSTDKIAKLILVTPNNQKILMYFNAKGRIGIKGFVLYFNAENVIYFDILCNSSEDGKHIWQTQFQSGAFHLKSCSACGRYVAITTDDIAKNLTGT